MLKRSRFFVATALAAATLLAAPARAQEVRALLDPLPIRDQYLLGNGFYFFEPEGARVLDDGESTFDLRSTDSNTFAKSRWISHSLAGVADREPASRMIADPRYTSRDTLFFVDGETRRTTLAWHRGVGAHLELGIAVPVNTMNGGWSDGLIEAIHHELRVGNAQREFLGRNTETVYLRSGNTTYFRQRSSGTSLGDVAITAKYELAPLEDDRYALAVQGAVELPTGNAQTLDGSGSLDAGVQLLMTRQFSRSRFHATLGILRLGANTPLGTKPQFLITDTIALSHLLTDATSAIAQLTISESPFKSLGAPELNRRSYQLTAGLQHNLGRYLIVHAALIENLINYENSADAGMAWGVSVRF